VAALDQSTRHRLRSKETKVLPLGPKLFISKPKLIFCAALNQSTRRRRRSRSKETKLLSHRLIWYVSTYCSACYRGNGAAELVLTSQRCASSTCIPPSYYVHQQIQRPLPKHTLPLTTTPYRRCFHKRSKQGPPLAKFMHDAQHAVALQSQAVDVLQLLTNVPTQYLVKLYKWYYILSDLAEVASGSSKGSKCIHSTSSCRICSNAQNQIHTGDIRAVGNAAALHY
jgi:hypothetical protein